jgi:hypothetical protein
MLSSLRTSKRPGWKPGFFEHASKVLFRGTETMPTPKQLEQLESEAAHKALEVFVTALQEGLEKLGGINAVEAFIGTEHVHYTLLMGGPRPVIAKYTIEFQASNTAVQAALRQARQRGDI